MENPLNSIVERWIRERTVAAEATVTGINKLWPDYLAWCVTGPYYAVTRTRLSRVLRLAGYTPIRLNGGTAFTGVRLRLASERLSGDCVTTSTNDG